MSRLVVGLAFLTGFLALSVMAMAQAGGGGMDNDMGFLAGLAGHLERAAQALISVLAVLPDVPRDLARVLYAITLSAPSWLAHPALPFLVTAAIAALVLAVPHLLRYFGGATLARWLAAETRFGRTWRLIAFDLAAFALSVAVAAVLVNLVFQRQFLIGKLAVTLVGAAVRWRLSMLVPEILLRPDHPELRLVPTDDARARLAMRVAGAVLALGILFITTVPVLLAGGLGMRQAQAMALVVGTVMAAGGVFGVHRFFAGAHGWRRLLPAAGHTIVLFVWLAWTAGVIMLDFAVYNGLVWSLGIVAATAAADRLLAHAAHPPTAAAERADAGEAEEAPAGHPAPAETTRVHLIISLRRMVLAVAGTVVAVLVARLWLVDILEVVDRAAWARVREAAVTALGVLVAGYLAYEALRVWTRAKFGPHLGEAALPGAGDDEHLAPASRLSSVMPLLQGVFGVMIIAAAVLLALSHLGINITPLIAGAGIFGLAISFGSQALVRDIVSGVFYMADDAFRVGEYIEAGKYKGTVEKIAIRSVRLRHQNGQIHTIPYGQLGAVTNYSRDFSTIKFNLRLARDTDVEKVRKITKKIGQEMLQDPEIGKEFIQQLKMQGVADVQENALVCRFKFTVRPGKPTLVQREALKRLYRAFTDQGVAFASTAVVVQSRGGTPVEMSAAAAMAAGMTATASPAAPEAEAKAS
ncbi:mechanosensitive ion channel [Chelatococcus sp. SYSU_G07232]|uniref:Mechanosensitive ion channel n=1 Tax=Chelatococcus albus TaxID=3047466 RepID=A0ABT7AIW8_9HYPH|nr:mechanosensitive ion channel family protein [Chelatococcus sp. SYSU_G07232]MDJ1159304.1 mechanosensitive ion channel [Chelatococcus sp. SYSU_G07232]